ncbi:MAG TPA: ABC transporter permease [Victivallales bacterium]|nr:ABC transporter permease [Victivallales bacterium]
MILKETLISALDNIRHSKMRSFLTMLGIIIGISAVIIISSIGAGQTYMFQKAFGKMGQNTLTVGVNQNYNGATPIPYKLAGLSTEDINFLKQDSNIKYISPTQLLKNDYDIGIHIIAPRLKGYNNIEFRGADPDFFNIVGLNFILGRSYGINSKTPTVVIGSSLAKRLFKTENPIGKNITFKFSEYIQGILGEYSFRIAGVVKNPYASLSDTQNENNFLVYIPVNKFLKITGKTNMDLAWATIKNNVNIEVVRQQIISTLSKIKNLPPEMFQAKPTNEWAYNKNKVMEKANLFILLIASIALLVGGIGIMNIMLVTVSERTKEIGIRKAIGATNGNILFQFLIEAIILSLLGGLIGIVLGYGSSFIVCDIIHIPPILNWYIVALSVCISMAIGIVFGIFPAKKAALLNPIDALRYE